MGTHGQDGRQVAGQPVAASASEQNRAYYDQELAGKDDYWRKMAAPRFRISEFLRLLDVEPFFRVCDLGCGGGQLLREIAERYPRAELCGVDLAETQVAANRREMPGAQFFAMDLDRPAAVPTELLGKCDVIVASELIEHVGNPQQLLRNALSLARPGGRLLLSTQSGPLRETERRVGHQRHFSVEDMRSLLSAAGWQPERVYNCGFPFHDLSKWYANRNPDASMKQFAEGKYGLREDVLCFLLRVAFRLNSHSHGAQLFAVARKVGS
jgi:2-polyprenyl-3-methyl-5-hydroxy-6-metoxy-1,4-benzoquinol methylase